MYMYLMCCSCWCCYWRGRQGPGQGGQVQHADPLPQDRQEGLWAAQTRHVPAVHADAQADQGLGLHASADQVRGASLSADSHGQDWPIQCCWWLWPNPHGSHWTWWWRGWRWRPILWKSVQVVVKKRATTINGRLWTWLGGWKLTHMCYTLLDLHDYNNSLQLHDHPLLMLT